MSSETITDRTDFSNRTRVIKINDAIDYIGMMASRLKRKEYLWLYQCINQIFSFRSIGCLSEVESENLARSILRDDWCTLDTNDKIRDLLSTDNFEVSPEDRDCPAMSILQYAVFLKNRFGFREFDVCLPVTAHSIIVIKRKKLYYVTVAVDDQTNEFVTVVNNLQEIEFSAE